MRTLRQSVGKDLDEEAQKAARRGTGEVRVPQVSQEIRQLREPEDALPGSARGDTVPVHVRGMPARVHQREDDARTRPRRSRGKLSVPMRNLRSGILPKQFPHRAHEQPLRHQSL